MDYSFLSTLKLLDPGRVRQPSTKNPTGMVVRVFNDGKVYPGKELADKFSLQYLHTNNPADSYGFDIIDSKDWTPLADQPRMLLFGHVPKGEKKVDLFSTTRYDDSGMPKGNVMTQGSVNKYLLDLVKEFGWLKESQVYVDLQVVLDHPFKTADGIAYIPKVIEKGELAGERTYVKREDTTFFPVEAILTEEEKKALETVTK